MLKLVIPACVLLVAPAFSATHKVPEEEPIIIVDIPDQWQTRELGESILATAPGDAVHLLIVPPEGTKVAETMGETMRYIRNSGGITVKPDSIKNEQEKINGMEARQISWQAKNNKGDIKIRFTILSVAKKKNELVACWGSPASEQKYKAALKRILQSVKPV